MFAFAFPYRPYRSDKVSLAAEPKYTLAGEKSLPAAPLALAPPVQLQESEKKGCCAAAACRCAGREETWNYPACCTSRCSGGFVSESALDVLFGFFFSSKRRVFPPKNVSLSRPDSFCVLCGGGGMIPEMSAATRAGDQLKRHNRSSLIPLTLGAP